MQTLWVISWLFSVLGSARQFGSVGSVVDWKGGVRRDLFGWVLGTCRGKKVHSSTAVIIEWVGSFCFCTIVFVMIYPSLRG